MNTSAHTAQPPASPSAATINIRNLRLRTLIGFNPDEKVKKQDVVLNIETKYATGDNVFQDNLQIPFH
jgi:D-erythro-7,8-dihydroneopterin triphosphate epimerase